MIIMYHEGEKMIAEVVINRNAKKLNRTFDYKIPKEMEDLILIGSKVLVPFGKGANAVEAFVVGFKENSEFELKDIIKIIAIVIIIYILGNLVFKNFQFKNYFNNC